MDDRNKQKEISYLKWLLTLSFTGALSGWIVQGLLLGSFIWWALPILIILCIGFTTNGDNIIESSVLLIILGVGIFIMSRLPKVSGIIGTETMIGSYLAFAISKLTFSLAKSGVLGNKPFS